MRTKARKIDQAIQQLEQRLMRAPTEAEIAAQLDVPLNEYQALLHDAQGVQIVHYEDFATEPDSASGQSDWSATLNHGSAGGNPLDSLLAGDFRQALIHAIDALPDREKLLLSLCYEQGLNLKEIGAIMNVTEARVCQLRSQATARIRAKLKDQAWHALPQEGQIAQII
ncbi:RNA polymerase sigma factor FliA [compost metagenome]